MSKNRIYPPTLGPENRYGSQSILSRTSRSWDTQKRPYVRPLAYVMDTATIKNLLNTWEQSYDAGFLIGPASYFGIELQYQQAYNKAYAQFVDNLKADSAEMLTMYAERHKTFAGIAERAGKLMQGIRAAKKGDVLTLKRLWGKGAGVRDNLRKSGGHVLEYSFGYAPLVSDISSMVSVLGNGVPKSRVYGRATVPHQIWIKGSNPGEGSLFKFEISCAMGADVGIVNPNLALANQLGLLNPAATLWELTPWSFVVDYFINVSDFLNAFTDFAGFDVLNAYHTYKRTVNYTGVSNTSDPQYIYGCSGTGVRVERHLGIPRPKLLMRPPWRLSPQRALTSIALLLQQLK